MNNKNITQSGNVAFGDIAAGNITNNYYKPSALNELAQKFRMECSKDQHLSEFIEKLQHFFKVAPNLPSRNLEEKLSASGRADVLQAALRSKEKFTKKLVRLQFSEQAQEIFVHVLSQIEVFFVHKVRPKKLAGVPREQIDELIYNDLLMRIYDDIGSSELGVDLAEIQGMVYFLGGNCHISWD